MGEEWRSEESARMFEKALKVISGGVCSGTRGVKAGWDPYPLFIKYGKGSKIVDVDGNEYLDYVMALGPLILGHAHPKIIEAVRESLELGSIYGAPFELETKVAEKIVAHVPCAELVRFCCTGTEATMAAVRLARAYTGRNEIVKFEGHYHGGWNDMLVSVAPPLAAMGPEISPIKIPASAGIPEDSYRNTIVVPWNDIQILEKTIKRYRPEIAAVICEPCTGRGILPEEGYLQAMRELTEKNDILLIFDEVVTGFRLALGGAQEYYDVVPDLAAFGKALGGGFPISAIAGRRDIMELVGEGKSFAGGTFNSNTPSVAAAYAVLSELEASEGTIYKRLFALGSKLIDGINGFFERSSIKGIAQGPGPMFNVYFTSLKKIRNYREAATANRDLFRRFQRELLKRAVYKHPDHTEPWVLSAVHSEENIERTLIAIEDALKTLKG